MSDQLPVGQVAISRIADRLTDVTAPTVKIAVTSLNIKTLEQLEIEHIEKVLSLLDNNKAKAAEALGVTTKTLYNKLHAYGLFDKYASAK
jgi:DNA-binding NtrC family response regulator